MVSRCSSPSLRWRPWTQQYPCHQKAAELIRSADPALQLYADLPPGPGMAVAYVGVNKINGMMYAGQHRHQDKHPSTVRNARWNRHSEPSSNCVRLSNAINFYGAENFDWIVDARVPIQEIDELEDSMILPGGYNTLSPHGYNLKTGGNHGQHSEETIAKMKATRSTPEFRAELSDRAREIAKVPSTRHKRQLAARRLGSDPEVVRQRIESRQIPEAVARRRSKVIAKRLAKIASATTVAEYRYLLKWMKRSDARSGHPPVEFPPFQG